MSDEWFRVFAIYYKADKYTVMAAEELVSKVQNQGNCSRTKALRRIFDNGIQSTWKQLKEEGVASATLDANCEKAKLFHELKEEAAKQQAFNDLVNAVGLDRVLEKAQERGIDIDQELAAYSPPIFNQTTRIKAFIQNQLSDGKSHPVSELKQAAIDHNVVAPPEEKSDHERDWSLVKKVASELGVSDSSRTRRGYWKAQTEKVS